MGRAATQKGSAPKRRAKLTKPAPLRGGHILRDFNCGEDSLNYWLWKHALLAQAARTATTVVVCRGRRVAGYFSIANGAVSHSSTSAKVRRNVPDPIPATVLGRLAVNKIEQGKGLGGDILREAMRRALAATRYSAARIMIVHPLNAQSVKFYGNYGFRPLKGDSSALYLPMETIADSL